MVGMVLRINRKMRKSVSTVLTKKSNVCVTLRGVLSLTYDANIFVYNKKLIYQPMIITTGDKILPLLETSFAQQTKM